MTMVTIQLDMQYSQSDVLSGHPSNTSVQLKGFVIKSIDPITFVYSHAVVDILLCYPRVIQSNVWHIIHRQSIKWHNSLKRKHRPFAATTRQGYTYEFSTILTADTTLIWLYWCTNWGRCLMVDGFWKLWMQSIFDIVRGGPLRDAVDLVSF